MPQRTAANTRAGEDLKATEMSVNYYYTHIPVMDRLETNHVYRAKDYSIELTLSRRVSVRVSAVIVYLYRVYRMFLLE
jgi:hypothetical protein